MSNFVLMGAAGYVAPKHMEAIKAVGGNLLAILDPSDSVGIIDRYFPEAKYFSEFERFDRFCSGQAIDYVSICTPNYLHDAHCRFALRIGADAICEKPLVLKAKNLYELKKQEDLYDRRIWTIMQLRLNPDLIALNWRIADAGRSFRPTAYLEYHTPRGAWYRYSWKGNLAKSGGLVTNIGVHLFDLLCWLFGGWKNIKLDKEGPYAVKGQIDFRNAKVFFNLSILGNKPKRTLSIMEDVVDMSNNFHDLHIKSYQKIIAGEGFGVEDTRSAIELCEWIRGQ